MKKSVIMKKGAVLTLAAVMAIGLYSPAAVFATEIPEGDSPAVEEQIEAVAPQNEDKKVSEEAEVKEAPAIEKQEAEAVEEEAPAAEESKYGTEQSWGYGNESKTTKWVEYTKDGETILVFSTTGEGTTDEENAVTKLLDENGNLVKSQLQKEVTQIVFETGITGIGWTALYSDKDYQPLYGEGYYVDQSKTDLFNSFTKLTVVTPCETIKRIGWSAFRKCYNLKEFNFSKCTGLEEIMNQAFSECHSLNKVDLTDCNALVTIAWGAFNNAGKGTDASLTLPAEGVLAVIGGKAFLNFAANSTNGEVDFTPVACSVTKILQYAFSGTKLTGEITGFKKLETIGKDALGKYITYVKYDPSQDEPVAEEPAVEQPVVEQPVVEQPVVEQPVVEQPVVEQPVVEEPVAEEPAVEEIIPAAKDEIIPAIQEEVIPAIQDAVAPAIQAEDGIVTASADTAAAASNKAAASKKAAASNNGAVISDSAAPSVAPAASSINDDAVATTAPAADEQSGSSLGYVLGGLAAALMAAMAATVINRKRAAVNE